MICFLGLQEGVYIQESQDPECSNKTLLCRISTMKMEMVLAYVRGGES
jgi:hypothetical protein